jgi:hypothetical protein
MSATVRVKHRVTVLATLDSALKIIDFQRNDETLTTTSRSDCTEVLSQTLTLAKSTTDEAISFGSVTTAKFLYIETDQALTMKFNGGSDVLKLSPVAGSKAKLLWEGEFTAILLTNPSADTDAVVTYIVAG